MRPLIAAALALPLGLAAPASAQAQTEPSTAAQPAAEQHKTEADKLVEAYAKVQMPTFDRAAYDKDPQGYRAEYMKARNEALASKVEIGTRLLAADPTDEQILAVMPDRWSIMAGQLRDKSVLEESERFAASQNSKVAAEALFARANAMTILGVGSFEDRADAARAFHKTAPEDERFASVISTLTRDGAMPRDMRIALYKEAITAFPDSRYTAYFPGKIRQLDGIGKPFELSFTDANTGESVSMDQLRGKVVVVDFWATWCGPCIAEIPKVKEIYSQYKDQGLEIIGVSLDQPEDKGGLEALRKYCAENELTWPQYYQGNYWQSEFSTDWGINSIPAVFIIDKHGNLHSTEARGHLETMIPELLAKPGPQG